MTQHAASSATDNPWIAHPATICSIRPETPGVATYELAFNDPDRQSRYRFLPGQFNMLYLPGFGESAISISSDPEEPSRLLHTVRVAGNVTGALARTHPGETIGVRGPFGSAWPVAEIRNSDVVIACGGIGLAPLRPVIYHLLRRRHEYGRMTLLYGARSPQDLLFADEWNHWRSEGLEMEVTVDRGDADWKGQIGVLPALFSRLDLAPERTTVLTCGPEIMMRFVISEALLRNISARRIYLSMERNMNCAMGFCGRCQLGPAFVCKDGPVFTCEQMQPYLHLEEF
ncbi:FAD/NAD(P)-binding protein [Lignipirellula cremea]|uniref:Anaerobic sulfite reductase subunit B n=1 Tax=Lignipirellula cremea TaxID=2528010 RepID=A0A518E478_9BACT|nr:FAD/NAD(P)-binding protein [Lignipirellula cremea]QDU98873.1 Anaerobic sulfite reductase subunit B [Lignipirellula cremea]